MAFSKKDKILFKNLQQLKGCYGVTAR